MGVFKKRGKWWVDYYVNGVRVRKAVSKSKGEALKVLTKIKSDILHKRYAIPKDEKIRFSDFAKLYLEKYSLHSKRSYKSDIYRLKNLMVYFGDLYIDEISDYHYEQYRNMRVGAKNKNSGKPISTTSINREGALLRAILNRAVRWGYLSFNPISKIEMFKEEPKERILNNREIRTLVSAAKLPLKYMILIALNTGMRRGEILNLEWSQVNLDPQDQNNNFITVKKTKSSKIRRIPLNSSLIELFSKLQLYRKGRDYVFINPKTGKPFTDIKNPWKNLLKRTGIKDLRFHDLRHIFATYTLMNSGDLVHLKETLGHSQITTTTRYTKSLWEGQQKLVRGFEIPETEGEVVDFPERKTGTK